ncbi:MAG: hypothetical protein AAFY46_17445, partial [Planctomycetota bacterium]
MARRPTTEWAVSAFEECERVLGDTFCSEAINGTRFREPDRVYFMVDAGPYAAKAITRALHRTYAPKGVRAYAERIDVDRGSMLFRSAIITRKPYAEVGRTYAEMSVSAAVQSLESLGQSTELARRLCSITCASQFYIEIGEEASQSIMMLVTEWETARNQSDAGQSFRWRPSSSVRGVSCCFGFARSAASAAFERTHTPPVPWTAESWRLDEHDTMRVLSIGELRSTKPTDPDIQ